MRGEDTLVQTNKELQGSKTYEEKEWIGREEVQEKERKKAEERKVRGMNVWLVLDDADKKKK